MNEEPTILDEEPPMREEDGIRCIHVSRVFVMRVGPVNYWRCDACSEEWQVAKG